MTYTLSVNIDKFLENTETSMSPEEMKEYLRELLSDNYVVFENLKVEYSDG